MADSMRKFVALFLLAGTVTGCASVKVVRNPDEGDRGVRYFRPKPYLLVTPAEPTGRMVNLKLEYLPDFSEEYSAHVKGKASIALKDGWNLVGVNTKEAPKEKDEPPAKVEDIKLPPAVVAATNVPIGYYESVYGFSGGRKFLQGWRYIGMTVLGGGQPGVCRVAEHAQGCPEKGPNPACINGPLHGLVFFNGVMTFRQLDEIANNQLCPMYVNPIATPGDKPEAGESGTMLKAPAGESGTMLKAPTGDPNPSLDPVPAPRPEPRPTPPPPSPSIPQGGSASLDRPTAPALAVAPPRITPTLAAPVATAPRASTIATVDAPRPAPARLASSAPRKLAVAPNGPILAPFVWPTPTQDRDLSRASTSPNP